MLKQIAPIRVASLILLAACEALSQKRPSPDLLQGLHFDGSGSAQVQLQDWRPWSSLPDAPSSMQPPRRAERLPMFVNETGSPFSLDAAGASAVAMRSTKLGHAAAGVQPTSTAPYPLAFIKTKPNAFLGKYLYQPLLKQDTHYYASTSDGFIGRASYAATRVFVTRDLSGKMRLNTSYFLGVLTSVASASARRPYWARSTSGTFNNFGSTIGSSAGINVFHEFGPGIGKMVAGHAPKFVARIAEQVTRRNAVRNPER